jgi:hypothetical protein
MSDGGHFSRKAVDNAGARYKDSAELASDRALIQAYRAFRCDPFPEVFRELVAALDGQPVLLSGRIKRVDTVIRKLRRERAMALTFMDDIVGFRIIVPSPQVQQEVVARLTSALHLKATRDYVEHPVETGYRAVHLIGLAPQTFPGGANVSNLTYEVQIRTAYQHLWSTTSESFGEQAKEGGGTPEQREFLAELSERIATFERVNPDHPQRTPMEGPQQLAHFTLIYDKPKGVLLESYPHEENLHAALRHYQYLENLHSINFSKEVVLLSAHIGQKELQITHARYYNFRGRPELPDAIRPGRAIPQ